MLSSVALRLPSAFLARWRTSRSCPAPVFRVPFQSPVMSCARPTAVARRMKAVTYSLFMANFLSDQQDSDFHQICVLPKLGYHQNSTLYIHAFSSVGAAELSQRGSAW